MRMSKSIVLGSLLGSLFLLASSGCDIETCEEGASCAFSETGDAPKAPDADDHEQCLRYCVRVSVCGGSQADDIDECVEECETRFDVARTETAELCACAEWSSCEDVREGRCSDGGGGRGGTSSRGGSSAGGSSNQGGSSAGGAPAGGSSNQGGSSAGGAPAGGSSAGGASNQGGSSAGGSASCTGGTSSGGGAGGEGPCTCDCDCAAEERCVEGVCTA
jgi:hypothetical protein